MGNICQRKCQTEDCKNPRKKNKKRNNNSRYYNHCGTCIGKYKTNKKIDENRKLYGG